MTSSPAESPLPGISTDQEERLRFALHDWHEGPLLGPVMAELSRALDIDPNQLIPALLVSLSEARSALEEERAAHEKTRALVTSMLEVFTTNPEEYENDPVDAVRKAHDRMHEERDALALKLERAMAVVDAAVEMTQDEPCAFCPGRPEVLVLGVGRPHDPDCPLVAQGFIDRDGKQLEAAGKKGA